MSFSVQHLYFDDVVVGQQWDSPGRTVTEADVVNFAGVSGDYNPIHVDHHFAAQTPFKRPIAHGLLVLSVASGLTQLCPPMRTVAFLEIRDWQFKAPVFMGDTVRVRCIVQSKELRGRGKRGVVVWKREIRNQDDKIAQEGIIVTLVECRPALVRHEEAAPSGDDGATAS
jgi:acyl dehydratase